MNKRSIARVPYCHVTVMEHTGLSVSVTSESPIWLWKCPNKPRHVGTSSPSATRVSRYIGEGNETNGRFLNFYLHHRKKSVQGIVWDNRVGTCYKALQNNMVIPHDYEKRSKVRLWINKSHSKFCPHVFNESTWVFWQSLIVPVIYQSPDSNVHGAKMGPTWVLSAPDGPMLVPWTLLSGSGLHLLWYWHAYVVIFQPGNASAYKVMFGLENGFSSYQRDQSHYPN